MTRDTPIRWRHVGDRYLATCIRGGRLLRAYSTRGWRVAVAMLEKRANAPRQDRREATYPARDCSANKGVDTNE